MKLAAISFTDRGKKLIEDMDKLCQAKDEGKDIVLEQYGSFGDKALSPGELVKKCFDENIPLLFVCASGIAVRLIAPHLKDKLSDPPVLVMDEAGTFIVPILSGHVGGANDLARKLSKITGATAVITTATDVSDAFSVDEFARDNHLTIQNRDRIKSVSSRALKGEPIRISIQDFPPVDECDVIISDDKVSDDALWLSPKRYFLGIGCKKGKSFKEIERAVEEALERCGIDYSDIGAFGSVDIKADEEGLIDLSRIHRIPFVTFSAEMLMKAKGDFTASDFVKKVTGTDNVCERAAVLLAGQRGELVVRKLSADGVTVAIARR